LQGLGVSGLATASAVDSLLKGDIENAKILAEVAGGAIIATFAVVGCELALRRDWSFPEPNKMTSRKLPLLIAVAIADAAMSFHNGNPIQGIVAGSVAVSATLAKVRYAVINAFGEESPKSPGRLAKPDGYLKNKIA